MVMLNCLQRETVRACKEFAARNQLPPKIQDQMLSHVSLRFKTEGLKQQETLKNLPKALRSNIAQYLFFPIVQKVQLFCGVSQNFLCQLVSEMEAEYFPPKEDVILINEAPTDMYILVSGAVVMVAQIGGRDQVVQKLLAGDIFGEIGVLCDRPQPFTVQTTELSQILRLNRTSLKKIIQANKADDDIIMSHLLLKLKALESQGLLEEHKIEGFYSQHKCRTCFKHGGEDQCHERSLMTGEWKATYKVETQECHDSTTGGTEAVAEKSRSSNYKVHSGAAITNFNNKVRVIIHMQSQSHEEKQFGKLITLPDSIEELFIIAGEKFEQCFTKIINTENAEVEDIGVIRDGDHLIFLQ